MKTLTRDEAKARFGKLTYGSGGTFHFLEFEDDEGYWVPKYDESLNLIYYELKEAKR